MILHRIRRIEEGKAEGVPQRTLSVALMLALACIVAVGCSKSDVITSSGSNSAEPEAPATVQEEPSGVYVLKSVTPLMKSAFERSVSFDLDEQGNRVSASEKYSDSSVVLSLAYENDAYGNIETASYLSDVDSGQDDEGFEAIDYTLKWNNSLNSDGFAVSGVAKRNDDYSYRVKKEYRGQRLTTCTIEDDSESLVLKYNDDGFIGEFLMDNPESEGFRFSYYDYNVAGKPEKCRLDVVGAGSGPISSAVLSLEYDEAGCLLKAKMESASNIDEAGNEVSADASMDLCSFDYVYVENPSPVARMLSEIKPPFFIWGWVANCYITGVL